MALDLKFCASVSNDSKSLCVTDTTGVYSVSNTGGWGAPNPEIADATAASVTIAKRNNDGTYTSPEIPTQDVYPDLPNITNTEDCLLAEDFGYGTDAIYEDGIYRVTYSVTTTGPVVTTTTKEIPIINSINCCIQKMALKVSTCECNCEDIEKKQRDLMFYYRLLRGSIGCGTMDDVQNYIDKLTKMCATCGCGC